MSELPEGVSHAAHDFVQRCQVAAGEFCISDSAHRSDSAWNCLRSFPTGLVDERDLIVAACAVCLLATAYIKSGFGTTLRGEVVRKRRTHVNHVLDTVQRCSSDCDLSLHGIALQMRLSQAYLSRAIAAESQYSFPAHVNGVRLLKAVTILRDSSPRVKQVAVVVGYSSTGELDRQMHRWFGLSPSLFRALLRRAPRHVVDYLPVPVKTL